MMKKLYTIKPPEWRLCGLWWVADTTFGQLAVHSKKYIWDAPGYDDPYGSSTSIEDGKSRATAHHEKAMAAGLVEHVCEWRDFYGDGNYRSGCDKITGDLPYFDEDPFCPACGGRITEATNDH